MVYKLNAPQKLEALGGAFFMQKNIHCIDDETADEI